MFQVQIKGTDNTKLFVFVYFQQITRQNLKHENNLLNCKQKKKWIELFILSGWQALKTEVTDQTAQMAEVTRQLWKESEAKLHKWIRIETREFFSGLVESQQTIIIIVFKVGQRWLHYTFINLTIICAAMLFWSGKQQWWRIRGNNLFWVNKGIKFVVNLSSESIAIQHLVYRYAYRQSPYRHTSMYRYIVPALIIEHIYYVFKQLARYTSREMGQ